MKSDVLQLRATPLRIPPRELPLLPLPFPLRYAGAVHHVVDPPKPHFRTGFDSIGWGQRCNDHLVEWSKVELAKGCSEDEKKHRQQSVAAKLAQGQDKIQEMER